MTIQMQRTQWKLDELAEHTGVPARTIRMYIARGLLPGPLQRGRNAVYGQEHVHRLEEIRKLQKNGLTLQEIALRTGDMARVPAVPEPISFWRYEVADDVEIMIQTGVSPWRKKMILNALARFAAEIAIEPEGDG